VFLVAMLTQAGMRLITQPVIPLQELIQSSRWQAYANRRSADLVRHASDGTTIKSSFWRWNLDRWALPPLGGDGHHLFLFLILGGRAAGLGSMLSYGYLFLVVRFGATAIFTGMLIAPRDISPSIRCWPKTPRPSSRSGSSRAADRLKNNGVFPATSSATALISSQAVRRAHRPPGPF